MASIVCTEERLQEVIAKSLANSIGVKQSKVEADPPHNILEQFSFSNGGVQCQDDLLIVTGCRG